jgi:hypothetical protein
MRPAQSLVIAAGIGLWAGATVWELAIFAKLTVIAANNATLKHILSTSFPQDSNQRHDYGLPPAIASGPVVPWHGEVASGTPRKTSFRFGSWLCEKAKTLNRDRRSYSSKTVLVAHRASGFNLKSD